MALLVLESGADSSGSFLMLIAAVPLCVTLCNSEGVKSLEHIPIWVATLDLIVDSYEFLQWKSIQMV